MKQVSFSRDLGRVESFASEHLDRIEVRRRGMERRIATLGRRLARLDEAARERARRVVEPIFRWVKLVHSSGAAERVLRLLQRAGRPDAELDFLGPIWRDGGRADGHTGSYWAAILLSRPGLLIRHRSGPAWGDSPAYHSAENLVEAPLGVLVAIHRAVASGAAWSRAMKNLSIHVREGGQDALRRLTLDLRDLKGSLEVLRRSLGAS
jgi:hypothetical protein